jgi:hypothetical protein
MELVYLEWEDASGLDSDSWVPLENAGADQPTVFKQVGFVVDINLDAIVLTEAYSDAQMAPRTRIPLGMVRTCIYLRV